MIDALRFAILSVILVLFDPFVKEFIVENSSLLSVYLLLLLLYWIRWFIKRVNTFLFNQLDRCRYIFIEFSIIISSFDVQRFTIDENDRFVSKDSFVGCVVTSKRFKRHEQISADCYSLFGIPRSARAVNHRQVAFTGNRDHEWVTWGWRAVKRCMEHPCLLSWFCK